MTSKLNWTPEEVVSFNTSVEGTAFSAFVGVAVCTEINGEPVIILAKSVGSLTTLVPTVTGKPLVESLVYAAAMVSASAVNVVPHICPVVEVEATVKPTPEDDEL